MSHRIQLWTDDPEPGWILTPHRFSSREAAQRHIDESGRTHGYAILKARYSTVKLVSPRKDGREALSIEGDPAC